MGRPGRRRNRTVAVAIVADGVACPLQMLLECRGWRDLRMMTSCGKISVRQRVKQLGRQLPVPPSLNGRSPWWHGGEYMYDDNGVAGPGPLVPWRDQLEASYPRKRDQKHKMCILLAVSSSEPPEPSNRRHHARLHIALLKRLQTVRVHSHQPSPRLLRPALP